MWATISIPTSTPRISKIEPPLQREHDFSKNRLSKLCTFLIPFGCQLASIFPPQIHQNPFKNRFQEASIFSLILALIFVRFGLHLGAQVGAMLASFSSKMGRPCGTPPPLLLGLSYFPIVSPFSPPLGPIWARFGRVWTSILEVWGLYVGGFWLRFGSHVLCDIGTFLIVIFYSKQLHRST